MTTKEKSSLWLSVLLSVAIWSFLYGPGIGVIFTFALLFHEYGHYYWMGREGIKNKTMTMVPPFGAIATSREPFPSLGAEARIALAGPGFGFLSAIVLLLVGYISEGYTIKIAVFIVCLVNLFNLCAPIAVLDGGRVIKSILFSFNARLGISFYYFSFFILFLFVWWYPSFFTLTLGFIIFNILLSDFYNTKRIINNVGLIKMSGQEIFVSTSLFLFIFYGLYRTMLINDIWHEDFIKFILN